VFVNLQILAKTTVIKIIKKQNGYLKSSGWKELYPAFHYIFFHYRGLKPTAMKKGCHSNPG